MESRAYLNRNSPNHPVHHRKLAPHRLTILPVLTRRQLLCPRVKLLQVKRRRKRSASPCLIHLQPHLPLLRHLRLSMRLDLSARFNSITNTNPLGRVRSIRIARRLHFYPFLHHRPLRPPKRKAPSERGGRDVCIRSYRHENRMAARKHLAWTHHKRLRRRKEMVHSRWQTMSRCLPRSPLKEKRTIRLHRGKDLESRCRRSYRKPTNPLPHQQHRQPPLQLLGRLASPLATIKSYRRPNLPSMFPLQFILQLRLPRHFQPRRWSEFRTRITI